MDAGPRTEQMNNPSTTSHRRNVWRPRRQQPEFAQHPAEPDFQSENGRPSRPRAHRHRSHSSTISWRPRAGQNALIHGFVDSSSDTYHRTLPSQDFRVSGSASEEIDSGNTSLRDEEHRNVAVRRHERRNLEHRRQDENQQISEGSIQLQRPFADGVEASREAVAEALHGLSINIHVQKQATETPRTSVRGLAEEGRWRRRTDAVIVPTMNYSDNTIRKEDAAHGQQIVPFLVQELVDKLVNGKIECMICYDMVNRKAAIWSCGSCYSIFHISCIRKWARAPTSADISLSATRNTSGCNWRCPGCQSVQLLSADELKYWCFCSQVVDPPIDFYITPHSCGGPCRKPLNKGKDSVCKHVCTMQCHPGPCPPCAAVAPPQSCSCGKTTYVRRCSDKKSSNSCGQTCGLQLPCGRHYCDRICHEGPCGQCSVLLNAKCFCGRKEDKLLCGSVSAEYDVSLGVELFSCGCTCSKFFECGKHKCMKQCHPGDCGECDLASARITTCPCGKKSLHELLGSGMQRKSCSDPVPVCGQQCEKLLPCGVHICQNLCHVGLCPPCSMLVEQKCRCGSLTRTAPCYATSASRLNTTEDEFEDGYNSGNLFLCNRKCGKKKNCGRHRCNNTCCDGGSLLCGTEYNPHFCFLLCGKRLRCGQHTCQETCHTGHCPPCLESIFTELSCACGRTSIPPPVACGTPPPSCLFPCAVPQPCGHPASHTCHFGDCPPCTVPSAKECVGNHVILRNVPCGSGNIKCNKVCGKTRQCGLHACSRTCHLPPCDTPTSSDDTGTTKSCGQPCGAPRRDCQHTCTAPCHPSTTCPDSRCKFPVKITCCCGRLSADVPCDVGDLGRGDPIAEAACIAKLPSPLQPVEGRVRVPLGQRKLACDDECAKFERKRILADAFGVNLSVDSALEGSVEGSEALTEMTRREPQWVISVEDRFKYLVLGTKTPTSGQIRVHVFCSLPKERRDVIRQLAERWNLSVNMVGREPRRFVTVSVTIKTKVPTRYLIGRAPLPLAGQAQPQPFNAAIDMDPRLVLGLFDLPREADISTLVLRFGGECELVWLNDKNALAVFSDAARANTALRRVDCASTYHGAVGLPPVTSGSSNRGWGVNSSSIIAKTISRRKNVQESLWMEDAWGDECGPSQQQSKPVWPEKESAIATTSNPWGALQQAEIKLDAAGSSVSSSMITAYMDVSSIESTARDNNGAKDVKASHLPDAADDWEETFY